MTNLIRKDISSSPYLSTLKKLSSHFSSLSHLECESCQFAKCHRMSHFPQINKHTSSPFMFVHSDVCGPCPVPSKFGYRYFVTFVDNYSCVAWLYLMKTRSQLFLYFVPCLLISKHSFILMYVCYVAIMPLNIFLPLLPLFSHMAFFMNGLVFIPHPKKYTSLGNCLVSSFPHESS